ncbi:hypothetical protein SEVIR_7G318350v4 [Setaria viridis]
MLPPPYLEIQFNSIQSVCKDPMIETNSTILLRIGVHEAASCPVLQLQTPQETRFGFDRGGGTTPTSSPFSSSSSTSPSPAGKGTIHDDIAIASCFPQPAFAFKIHLASTPLPVRRHCHGGKPFKWQEIHETESNLVINRGDQPTGRLLPVAAFYYLCSLLNG